MPPVTSTVPAGRTHAAVGAVAGAVRAPGGGERPDARTATWSSSPCRRARAARRRSGGARRARRAGRPGRPSARGVPARRPGRGPRPRPGRAGRASDAADGHRAAGDAPQRGLDARRRRVPGRGSRSAAGRGRDVGGAVVGRASRDSTPANSPCGRVHQRSASVPVAPAVTSTRTDVGAQAVGDGVEPGRRRPSAGATHQPGPGGCPRGRAGHGLPDDAVAPAVHGRALPARAAPGGERGQHGGERLVVEVQRGRGTPGRRARRRPRTPRPRRRRGPRAARGAGLGPVALRAGRRRSAGRRGGRRCRRSTRPSRRRRRGRAAGRARRCSAAASGRSRRSAGTAARSPASARLSRAMAVSTPSGPSSRKVRHALARAGCRTRVGEADGAADVPDPVVRRAQLARRWRASPVTVETSGTRGAWRSRRRRRAANSPSIGVHAAASGRRG